MADNKYVELGDRVKDKVTGFEGIAVSSTSFLNGCRRVCVAPPVKEDGTFIDERWFDVEQMEVLEKEVVKPVMIEPVLAEPMDPSSAPVDKNSVKGGYPDYPGNRDK